MGIEDAVVADVAAAAAVYAGWQCLDGASAVYGSHFHQMHFADHIPVRDSQSAGGAGQSRSQDQSNLVRFGDVGYVADAGCGGHVVVAAEYAVGYSGSLSAADDG